MTDETPAEDGQETPQTLTFAEEYVMPVLKGEKTATVRYPIGRDALPGDELRAQTPDGPEFATLKVTRTARGLAVEAHSLMDVFGALHGTETPHELVDELNEHYDAQIRPSTMVQVVAFEVVSRGE